MYIGSVSNYSTSIRNLVSALSCQFLVILCETFWAAQLKIHGELVSQGIRTAQFSSQQIMPSFHISELHFLINSLYIRGYHCTVLKQILCIFASNNLTTICVFFYYQSVLWKYGQYNWIAGFSHNNSNWRASHWGKSGFYGFNNVKTKQIKFSHPLFLTLQVNSPSLLSLEGLGALKRARFCLLCFEVGDLLGASVLGHSLGSFGHGMLGQLTGEKQTDCGLDLSGGDGAPSVVVGQTRSLGSNALEDVVDKGVHDGHGLWADAGVRMYLLQNFVDVDWVGFPPPPLFLLIASPGSLRFASGLLRTLRRWFRRHFHWRDREKCAAPDEFWAIYERRPCTESSRPIRMQLQAHVILSPGLRTERKIMSN